MPTQVFHRLYWENSDTVVTPVVVPRGGYPTWQSSVVFGSGFGACVIWWDAVSDWIRWSWTIIIRSYRYDRERRIAVVKALDILEHPAYPLARAAVRKTATTIGFNRPEAWRDLSRDLRENRCHAENAYRHLEACRLVRANLLTSTLTNPECQVLVELAYQAFAVLHK